MKVHNVRNLQDLERVLGEALGDAGRRRARQIEPDEKFGALFQQLNKPFDALRSLIDIAENRPNARTEATYAARFLRVVANFMESIDDDDFLLTERLSQLSERDIDEDENLRKQVDEMRDRSDEKMIAAIRAEWPELLTVETFGNIGAGIGAAKTAFQAVDRALQSGAVAAWTETREEKKAEARCDRYGCKAKPEFIINTCDGDKHVCRPCGEVLKDHMLEVHEEKVELQPIH